MLAERGTAETQLVSDLQEIAAMSTTPAAKAVVARLLAADGEYDEIGYEIIQAVYANDNRLVEHLDKTRGERGVRARRRDRLSRGRGGAEPGRCCRDVRWPPTTPPPSGQW